MTLETWALNDSTGILLTAVETPSVREGAFRRDERLAVVRTDETNLVRRVRTGDQSAFRELVERYQSRIFRVLYGILNHRADAEDVAQEVFAKVYLSVHRFDHRSSLFTWIYRIAVNEAYGHLRKTRTRRLHRDNSFGEPAGAELNSVIDGRPTPDRAAAQRDFVNKLLALIPEDDRLLLLWKEVEGYSVREMAEMTGMNENTVKVKLFRARRKLAELAARLSRASLTPGLSSQPVGVDLDRL